MKLYTGMAERAGMQSGCAAKLSKHFVLSVRMVCDMQYRLADFLPSPFFHETYRRQFGWLGRNFIGTNVLLSERWKNFVEFKLLEVVGYGAWIR